MVRAGTSLQKGAIECIFTHNHLKDHASSPSNELFTVSVVTSSFTRFSLLSRRRGDANLDLLPSRLLVRGVVEREAAGTIRRDKTRVIGEVRDINYILYIDYGYYVLYNAQCNLKFE